MPKKNPRRSKEPRVISMYNKRARKWGESYMFRHWWRVRAMYDIEDIRQDVFSVWLRVYRRHPGLKEEDLFRIFKRGVQGRIDNRSRQCFPNSYAYEENKGKLVLELDEALVVDEGVGDIESVLVNLSDLIPQLPSELADVLTLLVRDFLGVPCIDQRKRKRLKGKDRVEPVSISLARALGIDTSRDLMSELTTAISTRQDEYE